MNNSYSYASDTSKETVCAARAANRFERRRSIFESSNKPFCDGTHATIDFDGTLAN